MSESLLPCDKHLYLVCSWYRNVFVHYFCIIILSLSQNCFYSQQPRPQYSPVTADPQYGTYSPNSKRRYSPDIKKFTTLDSKRYSPVVVSQSYSPVEPMNIMFSPDSKAQRSQENLDALLLRTESRASRSSMDSERRRYSPRPQEGGTPQSQRRYLHNLMEGEAYFI